MNGNSSETDNEISSSITGEGSWNAPDTTGEGILRVSSKATYGAKISAGQLRGGMFRDLRIAPWSEWQESPLESFSVSSNSTPYSRSSASGSIAVWMLRYELPENADKNTYAPATILVIHSDRSSSGTITETKEIITLNPGETTGVFNCDATSNPGTTRSTRATLFSGLGYVFHPILPDGSISTATTVPRASMPAPIVNISTCQPTNVRVLSDGTLIGNLNVSGTVTSDFCNTVPGLQGKIDQVELVINNAEEAFATITVNGSKASNGPKGRPYPFSGSFTTTINNVPLTEGNNTFRFSAKDKVYNIPGFQTMAATIRLVESDPGTLAANAANPNTPGITGAAPSSFEVTVTNALPSFNADLPDQVSINYDSGTGTPTQVILTETAANSGLFTPTSDYEGMVLKLKLPDKGGSASLRDTMVSTFTLNGGSLPISLRVGETTNASGVFHGGYTSFGVNSSSSGSNGPLSASGSNTPLGSGSGGIGLQTYIPVVEYPIPVAQSTGGEFYPMAMEIVGLQSADPNSIRLNNSMTVKKDPVTGKFFVRHAEDQNQVAVFSHRLSEGTLSDEEAAEQNLFAELQDNSFGVGFAKGLQRGGMDLVGGTADMVLGWAKYTGRGLLILGYGIHITFRFADTQTVQNFELIQAEQNSIHDDAAGIAALLADVSKWVVDNNIDTNKKLIQFITGRSTDNDTEAIALSEKNQLIFELAGELMMQAADDFQADPEGVKGYKVGRIFFEAAALLLPFAKAGTLAKVNGAVKSSMLTSLINNSTIRRWLSVESRGILLELCQVLLGGCFVAGTQVTTKEGLKNIEDIQTGELVWSRHELKPELSGWRPVTATMTTHPSEIYHITYEVDPPLRVTSNLLRPLTETIGTTFNHPFWVLNRPTPCFLPAGALHAGDILSLANGGSAEITQMTRESAPVGQTFTTYNFEVAEYHTYFVGQAAVWVHNNCDWYIFMERLKELRGNPGKAWIKMMAEFKNGTAPQADLNKFIEVLTKVGNQDEVRKAEVVLAAFKKSCSDEIQALGGKIGREWSAKEAFGGALYWEQQGQKIIRSPVPDYDFVTVGRDVNRYLDLWGPVAEKVFDTTGLINKITAVKDCDVIVNVSGLPASKIAEIERVIEATTKGLPTKNIILSGR